MKPTQKSSKDRKPIDTTKPVNRTVQNISEAVARCARPFFKITAGLICIVVAVIFAIAAFETIGLVIIVLPIVLGVIAGIFAVTGIALLINGIKEMNKKS